MSASITHRKEMAIAYLGPEATWSHQAASRKFGETAVYLPQTQIRDVFDAVHSRRAGYGVVPVENSTEGTIAQTLDLFIDYDLQISGQIVLRIESHLLGRADRAKMTRLYSHAQVFGQCRDWLGREMPGVEKIEVSSTARAAELAAHEPNSGALAGTAVAEAYELPILSHAIQDNADNATRFLIIGPESGTPTGADRTLIMFALSDPAVGLVKALRPFDQFKVSLRKIENRPNRRKAWEYYFFADVDGHHGDELLMSLIEELKKNCSIVKVLGSFPDNERIWP